MTHSLYRSQNAICYSGYRTDQSPHNSKIPSSEEIKEDLLILEQHWKLIRLYDCGPHAERVLKIIEEENLQLRVLLGAHIGAEVNNPNCPWGGQYPEEELAENKLKNETEVSRLIELANDYPEIIAYLSTGNEATVDWTDHLVPVESVIEYVRQIKCHTKQPVTFCENYIPWHDKLAALAEEVDFISVHTYPAWEQQPIENALAYTQQNYLSVAQRYPHKKVVITEAGWCTNSNGRGIPPQNVSEETQAAYYNALAKWCKLEDILVFHFEAFDEDWKGSDDPLEPEKHWGLFTIDRKPKQVMKDRFSNVD